MLCYILLLHQTTTDTELKKQETELCYIFLLHQTTTGYLKIYRQMSCVISFFYIKPQL